MASIRRLPSGRFQASVLLDDGSRTTATRDTEKGAIAWALEMEQERDSQREQRRQLNDDAHVRAVLSAVRGLIADGRLSAEQRDGLRDALKHDGRA